MLHAFLGLVVVIGNQAFPANAMYAQQLQGVPFKLVSRRADVSPFSEAVRLEVEQLLAVSNGYSTRFK